MTVRHALPLAAVAVLLLSGCKQEGMCGDCGPVEPDTGWALPVVPAYEAGYEAFFSLDAAPAAMTLHFTVAEWNGLLRDFDANPRNEVYRQADFTYGEGAAAVALPKVAVRLRGNVWSRVRPEDGGGLHDPAHALVRAHFKVKLDETFDGDESVYGSADLPLDDGLGGRSVLGVKSFNLKHNRGDPSYLREVVSYDLFRRAGVHAPRAAFARLSVKIGDEPVRYMGVYELIEDVDKAFLKRRFGANAWAFKSLWQQFGPADLSRGDRDGSATSGRTGIEVTDPASAAAAPGFQAYRPAYDLKTKEDEFVQAEAALDDLVTLLAGAPTREQLEAAVDVQAFLRAMAVNALVGMSDDYWRNGNNYYLAKRADDGRWTFIPYDYDLTFGFECIGDPVASSPFVAWAASHGSQVNPVLADRILAIPVFARDLRRYVAAYTSGADPVFHWSTLGPRLSALEAALGPHLGGYDAWAETAWDPALGDLQGYVNARVAVAATEPP